MESFLLRIRSYMSSFSISTMGWQFFLTSIVSASTVIFVYPVVLQCQIRLIQFNCSIFFVLLQKKRREKVINILPILIFWEHIIYYILCITLLLYSFIFHCYFLLNILIYPNYWLSCYTYDMTIYISYKHTK